MKNKTVRFLCCIVILFAFAGGYVHAQAPQKLSYQAVVFDDQNALVKNTAIGMQISILQNSPTGDIVFRETYSPNPVTNGNGVVTVEIGSGIANIGSFDQIVWSTGTYYIKSETDITGGTNYLISGTSQILSTPYALFANTSGDAFSGNYNDLTNKPVTDGSETKVTAGNHVSVTGSGTGDNPYVINSVIPTFSNSKIVFTSSQPFTVPQGASKIKVELWGGAGGGGGSGAYSYSYNLVSGGDGGGGGFASQVFDVTAGQQFDVVVGEGGSHGTNAVYSGGNYVGDTDGGNGGDSYFSSMKAAGGTGGKRGSYSYYPVFGLPGIDNIGTITAHPTQGGSNVLNAYNGLARSYIAEQRFTSLPGTGGSLSGYSTPTNGEGGCALITIIE